MPSTIISIESNISLQNMYAVCMFIDTISGHKKRILYIHLVRTKAADISFPLTLILAFWIYVPQSSCTLLVFLVDSF